MKKIRYILVVMALMFIVSGCNLIQVDEAKDAATVIATVNDYKVTKADYNQVYNYYLYYYQNYGIDLEGDEQYKDTLESIKSDIFDMMIQQGVQVVKAQQNGCYDFTADEQADIDAYVQEQVDYYRSSLKSQIQSNQPDLSEDDLNAEIDSQLPGFMEEKGTSQERIRKSKEDSTAMDKLYAQSTEDVQVPTEDEVKAEFDKKVEDQKSKFADGSESYEQDVMYGEPIYYVPVGVREAKHILIKLPDDQATEISTKRQNGDDDGADAARAEYLKALEPAAQEAYQRAIDGEDFDALISELGEDPGMQTNEYYQVMNPSGAFDTGFTAGLFALEKPGDISEPVGTDFGYHIILYYGDVPSGPVDFESMHDAVYDEVYTKSKDDHFNILVQDWEKNMKIKKYPNRID